MASDVQTNDAWQVMRGMIIKRAPLVSCCPVVEDRDMSTSKKHCSDANTCINTEISMSLQLTVLPYHLSVCICTHMPSDTPDSNLWSVTRTSDELSLVCETDYVPEDVVEREDGWRALVVAGPLDFALVGILAKIAEALASAGVSLFALSTFKTDYVLVKDKSLDTAIEALRCAGCTVSENKQ